MPEAGWKVRGGASLRAASPLWFRSLSSPQQTGAEGFTDRRGGGVDGRQALFGHVVEIALVLAALQEALDEVVILRRLLRPVVP